jgi:hypothetical protein
MLSNVLVFKLGFVFLVLQNTVLVRFWSLTEVFVTMQVLYDATPSRPVTFTDKSRTIGRPGD